MTDGPTSLGRRAIIMAATTTVALGTDFLSPVLADPNDASPAFVVGLFTELERFAVPDAVAVIQTVGHSVPGQGAARYQATDETGVSPYRARTANGRWFALAEPLLFVDMFGALGGDPSQDDHPAIQAAIDYNEAFRHGVVWCKPGQVYYLGQTVVIDPTRTSIEAGSATWDFRLKSFRGGGEQLEENDLTETNSGHATALAPNACVLVRDSPAGTQYGQDSHYCRGLKVKGSPTTPRVSDGFYFDTNQPTFSSRWTFYNVEAAENLGRGLVLRNRTYLTKSYSSRFAGFHCGLAYLGGEDAGENLSFFGGTFESGGGPAIDNGGGELYLFGVSIDFAKSFIRQAGGSTHCFGCHFETGLRAGFIGSPFDIGGELFIDGGQIMGGAPLDGAAIPFEYFFYTRDIHSRIVLSHVWGYNWQSAEHVICGGAGRIVIERLLGGSNWNIPGIVKRDAAHSLLGNAGLFERPDAALDLWVNGQTGNRRLTRSHLLWSDNGRDVGVISAERTTTQARTGTACLAIAKSGVGSGTDAGCHILIPFPAGGGRLRSCEFWLKAVLENRGTGAAAPLFTRLLWASVIGRDGFGVPQLGQTLYTGEATLTIKGDDTHSAWTRLAYGDPLYTDPTDSAAGYSPAWATHLWLEINLVRLQPVTLYLDDFYAFAI